VIAAHEVNLEIHYIAMNARLRDASAIYVLDLTEVSTEEP